MSIKYIGKVLLKRIGLNYNLGYKFKYCQTFLENIDVDMVGVFLATLLFKHFKTINFCKFILTLLIKTNFNINSINCKINFKKNLQKF